MPDYDDKDIKNAGFNSDRNILYWNGHAHNNGKEKDELYFFTAAAATTYTINVNGFTANGEIIYKKANFISH